MIKIIIQFLPILCVCFTEVHTNQWDPRVWPEAFVDDGKPFIEFTCGAYLKSEDWLSWYRKSNNALFTTLKQEYEGYRTIKLLWPVADLKNDGVYCAKENETYFIRNTQYWKIKTQAPAEPIRITSKRNIVPPQMYHNMLLTQPTFIDDGTRVEFTCYARFYITEKTKILSSYQIKGNRTFELRMIQYEANYGYVKMTFQKTLEPSDNGSEIYCERHNKQQSQRIPIAFKTQVEAMETPYVTVEPSTDVVFFDENEQLEFVCSGSRPVDRRGFTWLLKSQGFNHVLAPDQQSYRSTNPNRVTIRMSALDHGKQLYCAQGYNIQLSLVTTMSYGELAKSRMITLLHRAQLSSTDELRVIPGNFVDEGQQFIQFTCYGFLKKDQLLSWYQKKGSNKSADSLLRTIQLQDPGTAGNWTVLTLNKTLEQSDNGSQIYCAKQRVQPDGSLTDLSKREQIFITFEREIPSSERPFISVEPSNTVSFEVNTTLRFVCKGSKPVDGRNYTWFRKDSTSSITVPKDQHYDPSKNQNVLDLLLSESHHMNELFCAQGHLSYISHCDGSLHPKRYGELVVSNIITLIQKDGNNYVLIVTVPLVLVLLALVGGACWALRGRCAARAAPPPPAAAQASGTDNNDDFYGLYANMSRETASPELTYAILDLPKKASKAAPARPPPETSIYAEIAGVCKR